MNKNINIEKTSKTSILFYITLIHICFLIILFISILQIPICVDDSKKSQTTKIIQKIIQKIPILNKIIKNRIEKNKPASILNKKTQTISAPIILLKGDPGKSNIEIPSSSFGSVNGNLLQQSGNSQLIENKNNKFNINKNETLKDSKTETSSIENQNLNSNKTYLYQIQSKEKINQNEKSFEFKINDCNNQLKTENDQNNLKLSDIFNNTAQQLINIKNGTGKGSGASKDLVIVQGDVKYYSFIQKIVLHLNQSLSFNQKLTQENIKKWINENRIKNNIQFAITLNKSGNVTATEILNSSGFELFDQLTLENIKLSSPLPPIPNNFNHESVRIELTTIM